MYYTVIKHSGHLRTLEKCRKQPPAARVVYMSLVFSNARRVSSQCNTRLRLLYLLSESFPQIPSSNALFCDFRNSSSATSRYTFRISDGKPEDAECWIIWKYDACVFLNAHQLFRLKISL